MASVTRGRYATAKMIAGVIHLIGEMAEDSDHPLRLQFDEFVVELIRRLKDEPGPPTSSACGPSWDCSAMPTWPLR